jgi:hypothetical protein
MVISHKYKYLFIEIPLTGSWAIRQELCKYYGGQTILHKHANYQEFLRKASESEKKYFAFATVRNPLDEAVSTYYKLKTDHKGVFSNSEVSIQSQIIDYADVKMYESIRDSGATFESVFMKTKLWDRPYSSMIDVSSNYLDFVIKFETMNEDFGELLRVLGVEPVRPIPVLNKTRERKVDWISYYTPNMIDKARIVYGPFMQKWGYDFPKSWGQYRISRRKQLEFHLVILMKRVYLMYFRYNDRSYAKAVRVLNAHLKKIWR